MNGMTTTAKMASHPHNADPSTTAALVLPSFTQSRTYTYDSEVDANSSAYTNNNYTEDDNTSMASESMASASTTNTANMSSPGAAGQGQYSSKSTRYKSAMTSRARQRRMRRMRERNGSGNNGSGVDTGGDNSVNTTSASSDRGGGLSLAPISPSTPNTPGSTPNMSPTNNSPARVQQAKEHVEQMKLYQEQMRHYRSTSSSPSPNNNNQQQQQQQQQSGGGVVTTPGAQPAVVLQPTTRLLEKSRNRSFGSRGGSRDPSPTPNSPYSHSHHHHHQQQHSPSSPDVIGGTAEPHHSATATATAAGARVVSSVSNTPQRSNSTNRATAPAACSPSTKSSGNDLISSYTTQRKDNNNKSTASKKKEQKSSSYRPNTTDFIPNWSIESPGDNGMLNPQEVQNAANYTSIKFQYSTLSGATGEGGTTCTEEGLEVFSDDGTHHDDAGSVLSGSVLSGSVFSGYGNTNNNNGRGTPLGMVGDLQNATQHHAQQQQQEQAESTTANNKQTWQNDVWSEATTPTILQGNEIFHQKAAASIVSLLSPNRMLGAGLMAPTISDPNQDESSKDVDGDSPTGIVPSAGNKESMKNMFTFDGDGDPSSSRGGEWRGMTQVNRTLFREDLDEDVKQSMIFQAFRQNMMQPSSQLSELLTQIHRSRGGVQSIDRAFATRRKNACGALKILSAKEENRMKICWTLGVLPAIASVLSDVSEGISDDISLAANTEARNRIVSTLLNLSVSKKNRMLIVNTPGVLESMVQTIQYDTGESRQGCCTVLLYLAKTSECRSMLVKSAGMMEALSKVIEVPKEEEVNKKKSTSKKSIKSRLLASVPVSPLGPGSPGESTLDDTIDTGRSSYRSEMSEDDDDSHSSHSGSHSSHSGSGSHSGASRDDEDGNDESVASNVPLEEVNQMEISFQTAETTLVQNTTLDATKKFAEGGDEEEVKDDFYDADPNRFLHGARLSIFACLLCCVKSKENAFTLAREQIIVEALIGVCRRHASPSHSRAISILAHLTRHPKNSHLLVYKYTSLLPMLQAATGSPDKEARRYAFCALQNLSMDKSCRAPIAHSPKIIWSLTQRCKDKSAIDEDEARMAAVATLQNLSDEPANLIQFTIVKDCIGTIISIAREDVMQNEKTDLTSFMAKNTLVTLSHWFRKIATSGSERMVGHEVIGQPKMMGGFPPGGGVSPGGSSPGGSRSQSRLYSAVLEPTNYSQWS